MPIRKQPEQNRDPYCFPGTNVLKNVPGILDRSELEKYESNIASFAADTLYDSPPRVTDLAYLKLVHKTIFGAVYPWAGETRRDLGRMTKTRENGSVVVYGDSTFVDTELAKMLGLLASEDYLRGLSIDRFAVRAAYFYGELDAIHPFREGNSRTLRAFFHGVAHNAGFLADWRMLAAPEAARDTLYRARDRAVMLGDSGPLAALFSTILSPL
jgi:cell filamentation protein